MTEISTLEYANILIHSTLIKEQKILMKVLTEKGYKPHVGYGRNCRSNIYLENKNRSVNDYRNYLWISVRIEDERHWLTLFYNDIDENAGNFHTQFGRLQFWRNVTQTDNKRFGLFKKASSGEGGWYLNKNDIHDPHIWIDSPDYDAEEVVNSFINFINEKY